MLNPASRPRSMRAPSRSCTDAAVTSTARRRPVVSTRMWRLRPVVRFPPSKPRMPHRVHPRLDRLAVDAVRRRMFVSPFPAAHLGPQRVVDPLPGTVVSPLAKVGVDTWPRRVRSRQHPPLDATDSQIENRIDDLAHIQAARSSSRFGRWNQILDNGLLAVGQVGWVSLRVHKHNVYHDLADSRYISYRFLVLQPQISERGSNRR
ncbi:MAG: hypothetical protein KatS3mg050_2742 [Litorilinea sp.]|nr:MAG: hypothetical protein KatS3mg050_2742 [Litorilinea sp.]